MAKRLINQVENQRNLEKEEDRKQDTGAVWVLWPTKVIRRVGFCASDLNTDCIPSLFCWAQRQSTHNRVQTLACQACGSWQRFADWSKISPIYRGEGIGRQSGRSITLVSRYRGIWVGGCHSPSPGGQPSIYSQNSSSDHAKWLFQWGQRQKRKIQTEKKKRFYFHICVC